MRYIHHKSCLNPSKRNWGGHWEFSFSREIERLVVNDKDVSYTFGSDNVSEIFLIVDLDQNWLWDTSTGQEKILFWARKNIVL